MLTNRIAQPGIDNKPQRTLVRPTIFDEHDVQTVRPTNNSETNIETNEIK